jgi:endonuclease/exonuclease/phosphatase family metal-dependent hydrolase
VSKHRGDARPLGRASPGSGDSRRRTAAIRGFVTVFSLLAVSVAGGVLVHHENTPGDVLDVSATAHGDLAKSAGEVHATTTSTTTGRREDVSGSARRSAPTSYRVHRGTSLQLTPAARLRIKAARQALLPKTSSFLFATLNVLGSQHSAAKGGFGPGTSRAYREAALLRARGIDLIGLQEVQKDQGAVLAAQLPGYTVWPRESLGPQGYRLQMAWRDDRFTLVEGKSTTYLFDHMHIPLPYALLRDNKTGAEFWFINAHNSPEGLQAERVVSSGIEARLVQQLKATGHPVLLAGDLNEHASVFCRLAAAAGLKSANGGYYSGGCHYPQGPLRIDWLMGSSDVTFSSYRQDHTTISAGESDHYLILADAMVTDAGKADQ